MIPRQVLLLVCVWVLCISAILAATNDTDVETTPVPETTGKPTNGTDGDGGGDGVSGCETVTASLLAASLATVMSLFL